MTTEFSLVVLAKDGRCPREILRTAGAGQRTASPAPRSPTVSTPAKGRRHAVGADPADRSSRSPVRFRRPFGPVQGPAQIWDLKYLKE